jgi:hypothetical protein
MQTFSITTKYPLYQQDQSSLRDIHFIRRNNKFSNPTSRQQSSSSSRILVALLFSSTFVWFTVIAQVLDISLGDDSDIHVAAGSQVVKDTRLDSFLNKSDCFCFLLLLR